jgi:hypothetical protein
MLSLLSAAKNRRIKAKASKVKRNLRKHSILVMIYNLIFFYN